MKVDVTTARSNGNYAPRNVGAIWIADANDKFVKTLRIWANRRRSHLEKWGSASGQNTVDAVTSATLSDHGLRSAMWDCSDVSHKSVPAGTYKLYVEFTERNGAGPSESVTFVRNGQAQMVRGPDLANFKGTTIQLTQ